MSEIPEDFKFLCDLDSLKEGEGKRIIVDDEEVALFKVAGEIFALNNYCPHQHSPIIYDGFIESGKVVCPAHGWEFDLRTGKTHTGGGGLRTYDVKVADGKIYAKITAKEWNW